MNALHSHDPNLLAACALERVVGQRQSLEQALDAVRGQLAATAHAYLQEVVFGSCRQYFFLDALLLDLLSKPLKKNSRLLHYLLVQSLYQLEFMRTPDYAVVDKSVLAAKSHWDVWAANLVNAVLRRFLRQREQLKAGIRDGARRYAMPPCLYDAITRDWPEQAADILSALNQKPPMTLRVNRRQCDRQAYLRQLQARDIAASPTVDSALGITLAQPVAVELLPGFATGAVSVQDESAQLVLAALEVGDGHSVLDACAAPGGKTALLLESQRHLKRLLAVDLPARVAHIHANLERLQLHHSTVEIRAGNLLDRTLIGAHEKFDRILLDAPCSGTGVIRRHPDIKHRRQAQDVAKFAAQQSALLARAWSLLAAGGRLLYVTCSILRPENDAVIRRFVAGQRDAVVERLPASIGLAVESGRQRLPGVHRGDGFYYSRLSKAGRGGVGKRAERT